MNLEDPLDLLMEQYDKDNHFLPQESDDSSGFLGQAFGNDQFQSKKSKKNKRFEKIRQKFMKSVQDEASDNELLSEDSDLDLEKQLQSKSNDLDENDIEDAVIDLFKLTDIDQSEALRADFLVYLSKKKD